MAGRDVSLFDRFGRTYDALMPAADRDTFERGLSHADRPVERVLDVAGGTGRAVQAVRTASRADAIDGSPTVTHRVVVDAARGMLRQVPADGGRQRWRPWRRSPPVAAVQGDATRLPIGDASADAAIIADALHHLPDHEAVLAEAYRVLRPGGVLVVQEFDPTTPLGHLLVAAEHLVGFDSTFHVPESLLTLLSEAGFDPRVVDRGFNYTVVGVVPRE